MDTNSLQHSNLTDIAIGKKIFKDNLKQGRPSILRSLSFNQRSTTDNTALEQRNKDPESKSSATPVAIVILEPIDNTFQNSKRLELFYDKSVKLGRQVSAKTIPDVNNGFFDSKVLSRLHAEIWISRSEKSLDVVYIKDTKSSNGTYVNGERLSLDGMESEPFVLDHEDILELGVDILNDTGSSKFNLGSQHLILGFEDVYKKVVAKVSIIYSNGARPRTESNPLINKPPKTFEKNEPAQILHNEISNSTQREFSFLAPPIKAAVSNTVPSMRYLSTRERSNSPHATSIAPPPSPPIASVQQISVSASPFHSIPSKPTPTRTDTQNPSSSDLTNNDIQTEIIRSKKDAFILGNLVCMVTELTHLYTQQLDGMKKKYESEINFWKGEVQDREQLYNKLEVLYSKREMALLQESALLRKQYSELLDKFTALNKISELNQTEENAKPHSLSISSIGSNASAPTYSTKDLKNTIEASSTIHPAGSVDLPTTSADNDISFLEGDYSASPTEHRSR